VTAITLKVDAKQVKQSMTVLGKTAPGIVNKHLDKAMKKAAGRVKKYPAKLAGQKYKRTGTFGRSVKVVDAKRAGTGSGTHYRTSKLVTDAKQKGRRYSKYVTGNAYGRGQAKIHENRWAVAQKEVSKEAKKLTQTIQKDIDQALSKK